MEGKGWKAKRYVVAMNDGCWPSSCVNVFFSDNKKNVLLFFNLVQRWQYFFFRYKGFYDYVKLKGVDVGQPLGLDVLVDGTVLTGAFC